MSQSKSKVLYKTPKYNNYFKENFKVFDAPLFIAEVTAHIPPKNKQYIRKKVYGVDPLVCPRCGSPMEIIAIIMDQEETARILKHLEKIGRPPPYFDPAFLN